MLKIIVNGSPFHSKQILLEEQVPSFVEVHSFANREGRAWKADWLASQTGFAFKEGMSLANRKHYAGELRAIGEYLTRQAWRVGLTWNDAASNSRGGHNVKRDISAEAREVHRLAIEAARVAGITATANTWSAQTALLSTDDGQTALAKARALIEAAKAQAEVEPVTTEPAKPKRGNK